MNVDERPHVILNFDPENRKFNPSFENLDINQNRDRKSYAHYCNGIGINQD
jgi:hypothetical protein